MGPDRGAARGDLRAGGGVRLGISCAAPWFRIGGDRSRFARDRRPAALVARARTGTRSPTPSGPSSGSGSPPRSGSTCSRSSARSFAWHTVIDQAMPPPRPRFPLVFSAFCVGLLANAVLPGRVGELARVAVLTRRTPRRRTASGRRSSAPSSRTACSTSSRRCCWSSTCSPRRRSPTGRSRA